MPIFGVQFKEFVDVLSGFDVVEQVEVAQRQLGCDLRGVELQLVDVALL